MGQREVRKAIEHQRDQQTMAAVIIISHLDSQIRNPPMYHLVMKPEREQK
jgi:hypothetical protein